MHSGRWRRQLDGEAEVQDELVCGYINSDENECDEWGGSEDGGVDAADSYTEVSMDGGLSWAHAQVVARCVAAGAMRILRCAWQWAFGAHLCPARALRGTSKSSNTFCSRTSTAALTGLTSCCPNTSGSAAHASPCIRRGRDPTSSQEARQLWLRVP